MPQPMSTPTTLGTTLSRMVMVVPMVQPLPECMSGMMRTWQPSVKGVLHMVRIWSIACSSAFVAKHLAVA